MKKLLLLGSFAMLASMSMATTLVGTLDISGVFSIDGIGDVDNQVFSLDLDSAFGDYSNYVVTGIGWDLTFFADTPSWLSEGAMNFTSSDGLNGVSLTPGIGDDFSGTATYSSGGIVDLVGLGLDFGLNDDFLTVEFFEQFDDFANDWDGQYQAGSSVTLQFEATQNAVPEPASMAVLGLGAAALLRRRKK